ncbi:beta-lysine acetyltransferase [Natranaerovirga hydrolytica]|uniref:Beta-lysine acetyltransferase n=1 Tax=Natranaerovirga hydrolytica TaxID=680378 RepID=A0A4V6NF82_9FIRM|nr:putative beta-lysine N-acetyltransferase [Natranaerovirga hydrolytica]TCK87991.1 beta-lysine acetyltransferase [Natranaerovirga hydrolytica]
MDAIETMGKQSVIQHGKHNDRIYLMKLSREDMPEILDQLNKKSQDEGYSKIFAKVPEDQKEAFIENGFKIEAKVPKMLKGKEDIYFLGKYLKSWRREDKDNTLEEVIQSSLSKKDKFVNVVLDRDFTMRKLEKKDCKEMAEVYRVVFETYPFPIHDYKYLQQTMEENFVYFGVYKNNELVGISSCEMDEKDSNVEMTDFATLPEYRGNKIALYLLNIMEVEMKKRNIKTAYTIARGVSFGMNITFAKMGYDYTGSLIKNTNIAGKFETMNVWYKSLS